MAKKVLGNFLLYSLSVSSTQDLVKELLLPSSVDSILWVAESQKMGRGRRGRRWISPKGGLYCSFSLGKIRVKGLGFILPLAVVMALELLGGKDIVIRWPNDIYWKGRKLAGILIEVSGDVIVCGIGVNISASPQVFDRPVVCLQEMGLEVKKEELLFVLLDQINGLLADRFDAIKHRYLSKVDRIPGKWRVRGKEKEEEVYIYGIDDAGLILTDKGKFAYLDLIG